MKIKKHKIVKVIQTVLKLIGQLIAINNCENNSNYSCISEIPNPQQFFKLGITRLSSIP